jgi:hypothetical protein
METSIIELSRYTAINTAPDVKSSWTNKLSRPLSINQGDALIVNQCFVDCTLIDNNTIFIENDVNLTFEFIYWIQNHAINLYIGQYDPELKHYEYTILLPDGLPYMIVPLDSSLYPSEIKNHPLIGSKSIYIKGGIYEKQALTESINRQLQGVQQPTNQTQTNNYFSNGYVYPQWNPSGDVIGFTNPLNPPSSNKIITSSMIPLYVYQWNEEGAIPDRVIGMCYLDGENQKFIKCYYTPMTDNPNYNYSNGVNSDNISSDLIVSKYGGLTSYIGSCTFTNANGSVSTFNLLDGGMIGASEFALEFMTIGENTGKFAFTYLHSPLLNNQNEVIGTYNFQLEGDYNFNDAKYIYLNAYSGIMLINIYQDDNNNFGTIPPFLEQLGFKGDDLLPFENIQDVFKESNKFIPEQDPVANNYVLFSYSQFLQYTTRNYFNLKGIMRNTATAVPGSGTSVYSMNDYSLSFNAPYNVYNFTDSETTEAINASSVATSSKYNTGHYLIELSGYGNSNEFLNNEKLLLVKAIVGNYMYSESFAMTLGDSSLLYIHNSEIPLTLTQIDVRILNPVSKMPDLNLGNNSSVYLKIIKEGAQPTTEKEQAKK